MEGMDFIEEDWLAVVEDTSRVLGGNQDGESPHPRILHAT